MVGIYKITSPSGKVYIGQSRDIAYRHRTYKKTSKVTTQYYIQSSILKYGWGAHTFEVIHELPEGINQEMLNAFEQVYMDFFRGSGFVMLNICVLADSRKGAKSGRPTKGIGKKLTAEHIANRSASLKETLAKRPRKRWSQESREKASKSHSGQPNPNKGKNYNISEEQKNRWSEIRKGVKPSAEATENHRKAMQAKRGIKRPPEVGRKVSIAKLAYYERIRQLKLTSTI